MTNWRRASGIVTGVLFVGGFTLAAGLGDRLSAQMTSQTHLGRFMPANLAGFLPGMYSLFRESCSQTALSSGIGLTDKGVYQRYNFPSPGTDAFATLRWNGPFVMYDLLQQRYSAAEATADSQNSSLYNVQWIRFSGETRVEIGCYDPPWSPFPVMRVENFLGELLFTPADCDADITQLDYDPYSGPSADPNDGDCEGGSGGGGTQYGPGDYTGGETVGWGDGVGNGGGSACGGDAVVEYICIDIWNGTEWETWDCGFVTTC